MCLGLADSGSSLFLFFFLAFLFVLYRSVFFCVLICLLCLLCFFFGLLCLSQLLGSHGL